MQVVDNADWVKGNFGEVDLNDKRLTKRLQQLASSAIKRPHASIVTQNPDWADTKAAYRFYDNKNVSFDKVAGQHWQQTRQTAPGRYLLICDTTDIDHTQHKAIKGLGILGNGKGRGMQLHSCLVFDSGAKQIVGTAGALIHYRAHAPKAETEMQRLNRLRESHVWGTLADKVGKAPAGSQWIHVWDRGGDNFESMCHVKLLGNDFIIRASRLNRKVLTSDGRSMELREACNEAKVLGNYELKLRTRLNDMARKVTMEVSSLAVTLPRPKHHSDWVKSCGIQSIALNVVIAKELNPPPGRKPLLWVVQATVPVENLQDALLVLQDYENRWLVEEYHKVIKSGCSIQEHALETAERQEPLIGLLSVVGTRILQLKLVGRNQPQAKAKTHIPGDWIEVLQLYCPKVDFSDMTVYHFVRQIAKLGGFLGRKGDGEPGWATIWRGVEVIQNLLDGIRLARST